VLSALYGTYGVRAGGSLHLEQSHTVRVVTEGGARNRREREGGREEGKEGEGGVIDRHEG
jgi:hypothetical protein